MCGVVKPQFRPAHSVRIAAPRAVADVTYEDSCSVIYCWISGEWQRRDRDDLPESRPTVGGASSGALDMIVVTINL